MKSIVFKNRSMKSEEDLRGQQTLHVGEPIHMEVIWWSQTQKSRITMDGEKEENRKDETEI